MGKNEMFNTFVENYCAYDDIMRRCMDEGTFQTRTTSAVSEFKDMVDLYFELKELYKHPKVSTEELQKKDSIESVENEVNEVLTDDSAFLNFVTKSPDKQTSGIEYKSGDKVLYSGINKQITDSVIKTAQFAKEKNGEKIEVKETGNDKVYIQIKDGIAYDLSSSIPNLYKMYFEGDGRAFNQALLDRGLTEKDTVVLSGVTDLSVNNDDESYWQQYARYAQMIKNPPARQEEVVVEDKKKHHM